jgi:hypothetical protein
MQITELLLLKFPKETSPMTTKIQPTQGTKMNHNETSVRVQPVQGTKMNHNETSVRVQPVQGTKMNHNESGLSIAK